MKEEQSTPGLSIQYGSSYLYPEEGNLIEIVSEETTNEQLLHSEDYNNLT